MHRQMQVTIQLSAVCHRPQVTFSKCCQPRGHPLLVERLKEFTTERKGWLLWVSCQTSKEHCVNFHRDLMCNK